MAACSVYGFSSNLGKYGNPRVMFYFPRILRPQGSSLNRNINTAFAFYLNGSSGKEKPEILIFFKLRPGNQLGLVNLSNEVKSPSEYKILIERLFTEEKFRDTFLVDPKSDPAIDEFYKEWIRIDK